MEYLKWLLIILVTLVSFPADVNSKTKADILGEKVNQLMEWSRGRSLIKFSSSTFSTYVRAKPRNYSVIVMFTALNPKRGCSVCQEAKDEFTILANSFKFAPIPVYNNALFFGVVDFDGGPDIFQSLGLKSAPAFIHFPAKGKRVSADTYEIHRLGFQADNLAKWASEVTGIHITIFRPPNYAGTVLLLIMFLVAGGMLYLTRKNLDFLYNKSFWGCLSIFIILTMTSGQMWNHIRGPPYLSRNPQTGAHHYIHPSSQGQLVGETHIVMVVHGLIVLGFILLNQVNNTEREAGKRRVMTISGLVLVFFFFSLLISIFRRKYRGYPYRLIL